MRKKALIASSFPAPYRVAVFQKMSEEFDLDVFFETCKDENRNADWFCKSGELKFHVLDNAEAWKLFLARLKHIAEYDFALAYDRMTRPGQLTIHACMRHGVPFFLNSDGWVYHKNLLKRAVKRVLIPRQNRAAAAILCSGKVAAKEARHYGATENKIFYHPFSSLTAEDILPAPVRPEEKARLRAELGLKETLTVLTIGQFIPRKGFDILIKAWEGIGDRAQLLIIGGGDDRPKYEAYIREHHISGITILDFMPKERLYRYYLAADLFVLPTREDIWGLVINEAMANALPVITTDNCMAGVELIENGVNGYIVKTESVEELREKLLHLIDAPEERDRMAAENLKKIAPYTMENVAKCQISAIHKVMKFES